MKLRQLKIPFGVRVMLFIIGAACGVLPFKAIHAGKFHMGNHGDPYDITQTQEPVIFWAMVFVFSLLSAGVLFVAFVNRKPDA